MNKIDLDALIEGCEQRLDEARADIASGVFIDLSDLPQRIAMLCSRAVAVRGGLWGALWKLRPIWDRTGSRPIPRPTRIAALRPGTGCYSGRRDMLTFISFMGCTPA